MSYGDSPGNPVLKTLHWAYVQSLLGELRSHIAVAEKKNKKTNKNTFFFFNYNKKICSRNYMHNFVFSNSDIKES